MWLAVFAAGFYNVFGVSIIPPYKTYIKRGSGAVSSSRITPISRS